MTFCKNLATAWTPPPPPPPHPTSLGGCHADGVAKKNGERWTIYVCPLFFIILDVFLARAKRERVVQSGVGKVGIRRPGLASQQ